MRFADSVRNSPEGVNEDVLTVGENACVDPRLRSQVASSSLKYSVVAHQLSPFFHKFTYGLLRRNEVTVQVSFAFLIYVMAAAFLFGAVADSIAQAKSPDEQTRTDAERLIGVRTLL